MSIACVQYFTRLEFNCCSIVRVLIGCSTNRCTCLSLMSIIFASSSVHSESCLACDSTTSLRLMKLSGVPNPGSLISFITLIILSQCFLHLIHCSWISRCGSREILAQYLVDCFMRLRLLSPTVRMPCYSLSQPYWTRQMYSSLSTACFTLSYHRSISLHVMSAMRVSS
jgi:hypothetical protein